jgi:phosphoglycerate dehydrogenase-like enzyme
MYHTRKKTVQREIVFASTPDRPCFDELWNEYTMKIAKELGFNITLIAEESVTADQHWPELLADADAIITTWHSPRIDEAILCRNHKLKIIGHAAGSVADYVSKELFDRGIAVTSANGDMAHSVAEWCLMGALMGIRRVMNYTRMGTKGDMDWPGRDNCGTIKNATVGIWGYGAISSYVHQMIKPFAPGKILVNSGHLSKSEAIAKGLEKVSLEKLFQQSDIIFTLTGLNDRTQGKIGAELLSSIKDNAVLVNAGRGQLIQEQPLINELRKNRFTGVFDVFHQEPLPENDPLMHLPNVILTPHNAGYPSRNSYIATILEEFDRFFRNAPLKYRIQPEKVKFMTMNGVKNQSQKRPQPSPVCV